MPSRFGRFLALALLLPASVVAQSLEPQLTELLTRRDYPAALTRIQELLKKTPDDYTLRELNASLHARMDDDASFDREVDALRKFRDSSSDTEIRRRAGFRVQMVAGNGRTAMITRCFETQGPLHVLYVALVVRDGETVPSEVIQVEQDTAAEAIIGKGPFYTLDSFTPGTHSTLSAFPAKPRFAEIRSAIADYLARPSAPDSSTKGPVGGMGCKRPS